MQQSKLLLWFTLHTKGVGEITLIVFPLVCHPPRISQCEAGADLTEELCVCGVCAFLELCYCT